MTGLSEVHRWTKTPKFILREGCIRALTADWTPGSFVEMGAGTGTMTRHFLDRGFHGVCYDIAEPNVALLEANLLGSAVRVTADRASIPLRSFDYLFAFEVLEHVERDEDELRSWTEFLRPCGRLLLSVPAHRRKYSRTDLAKGHVRRYERPDLLALLHKVGFRNVGILNYGFPLANVTRLAQNLLGILSRPDERLSHLSLRERSALSGIESSRASRATSWLLNERLLAPLVRAQRPFLRWDLGDGYVATGTMRK